MFHDTDQIIHIDANKLITSATILHLNIKIGLAGIESHVHECICKEFMSSSSTGLKFIEGFNNDN
jgi:hypothetical protein